MSSTSERPVLTPSADHPITITPTEGEVVVHAGGVEIARSRSALSLAEAAYPVVQYIPVADLDPAVVRSSDTSTYCPYKGDASYSSVETPEGTVTDAVWFYEEPYPAVGEIAGHVAFYADRVDVTVS